MDETYVDYVCRVNRWSLYARARFSYIAKHPTGDFAGNYAPHGRKVCLLTIALNEKACTRRVGETPTIVGAWLGNRSRRRQLPYTAFAGTRAIDNS